MSTSPQPPRPPAPPQPPRSGSNIVAIALLVLALIVLVSGIAVWTGLKFLSHNFQVQVAERGGGQKGVSINTPIGSLEVHKDVNEATLDLPLYPGATRVNDKDSATVDFGFGDAAGVHIRVAKFETSDSLARVKAFYKERLGSQVTKFTGEGSNGKSTFEIKTGDQDRVVALEGAGSKTLIKLVRITFGKSESN